MAENSREYGSGGWIGVGTPQANPTVEAEFCRLLPNDVEMQVARLRGNAGSSEQRMVDYIETLPETLSTFDTLKPDVFGFANTGSSYLVGAAREAEICTAINAQFGYPMVTAAQAVLSAFAAIQASRIAILAPYPQPIIDAGVAFWEATGLKVVAVHRLDIGSTDTRNIYSLRSEDALRGLESLASHDADAIMLSGTGMPSLSVIRQAWPIYGKPILSSNYCLAWALLKAVGKVQVPWNNDGPTLRLD